MIMPLFSQTCHLCPKLYVPSLGMRERPSGYAWGTWTLQSGGTRADTGGSSAGTKNLGVIFSQALLGDRDVLPEFKFISNVSSR